MRVIEPYHLKKAKKPKHLKLIWRVTAIVLAVCIVAGCILEAWVYNLPLPKVSANVVTIYSRGTPVAIPWPSYGQSALGTTDNGLLAFTNNQKAVPIASVAKIMTAIAVLRAKPLAKNDNGPTLSLTDTDVELYNYYVAIGGSVVPVKSGEQITERQALEAMLLPSANNMADSLAIWAFGSLKNYTDYANKLAKQFGLRNTTITSASGFDKHTVGTANDLVKLGIIAMVNPVLATIVSQKTATVPVVGQITNVNRLLGISGVTGIKTGNTDEAGGCYLFAAQQRVAKDKTITVVGAILGAPSLSTALHDSLPILQISSENFTNRSLVKAGDKIGYYDLPWGGQITAVANKDLSVWAWRGSNLSVKTYLFDLAAPLPAGRLVGNIQSGRQTTNIVLSSPIPLPSRNWRLFHRLQINR